VSAVKKFANSKIGRVIITAAAIYFGGAALAGGFGSSAAGGSFLSGMGTGVANAATSLSGAWGSALSGNFSAAGSSLSAGFQGTTTALQAANAGAMTAGMSQAQMLASQNAGISGATAATNSAAATAFPASAASAGAGAVSNSALALTPQAAGAGKGLIGSLSPMGQFAAISGGTQLVGGAVQGYGQQKAMEDERNYAEQQLAAQRARYESSVQDFSRSANAQRDAAQATENRYAPAAFDPVAEARAISERNRAEFDARNPTTGLVARGMQFQQPQTNNNFPVYNPYYFRG
jgi:hypothetical protein